MLRMYKGWSIEFFGTGYRMTRLKTIDGERVVRLGDDEQDVMNEIDTFEENLRKELTRGRMEYTIHYMIRKEPNVWHGFITDRYSTYEEAKAELDRRIKNEMATRQNGKSVSTCGSIGIETTHYREYDTIVYRIRKREVMPWETEYEITLD